MFESSVGFAQPPSDCGYYVEITRCANETRGVALSARSDAEGTIDCDYLWLTRYRLEGSITGRAVRVYPDRDTCYYLQLNCSAGCITIDTFCIRIVEPPNLSWQLPDWVCALDTVSLFLAKTNVSTSEVTVNWEDNNLLLVSLQESESFVIYGVVALAEGAYTLLAKASSEDSCQAVARGILRVRPRPVAIAGSDRILCEGDSIRLQGRSPAFEPGLCQSRWVGPVRFDNPLSPETAVWADSSVSIFFQVECGGCWSAPDSLRLQVLSRPSIEADTHLIAFCRDQSGVRLPVRVIGGTPPYFPRWEPPFGLDDHLTIAPFAVPPTDTVWTLFVLDAAGCAAEPQTIRAHVFDLPLADAGSDLVYCKGDPAGIRLQGRPLRYDSTLVPPEDWGRYAVNWVPAAGLSDPNSFTPIAKPDTTTIYTLHLRDRLTGCTNRLTILDTLATATVLVIQQPVADAGPDTLWVCTEEAVQLGGVAAGGTDLTYLWQPETYLDNPRSANPVARPEQSMRYTVQVANGPCLSDIDSIEIIVRERPVVRLDGPRDVCDGDTLFFDLQLRGGEPPYAFSWSSTDHLIQDEQRGFGWVAHYPKEIDILVEVRDRFCTGSEAGLFRAVVLPRPLVNIASDQLRICRGDTLQLKSEIRSPTVDYRITWRPSDSLIKANEQNPRAFPDQTTLYRVVVNHGPCESHDSVLVAVLPVPELKVEGGPLSLCQGQLIRLRAQADPADYLSWYWQQPNGTWRDVAGPLLEDRPEKTLSYHAQATLGPCTTQVVVPVQVNQQAVASFEISSIKGCGTWEVAFRNTSRQANTFEWDFGDGWGVSRLRNPTYRYVEPGRRWVQLIAGVGTPCPDTFRLPLELSHTAVSFGRISFEASYSPNQILYLPEAQIRLAWYGQPIRRGLWDLGDGLTVSDSVVTHRYTQAGDYRIRLIWEDSAGCVQIDTLPLLRVREPEVEVPTVFTPNGDGIHDRWEIRYEGVEEFNLQVFDRWGRLLFRSNSPNLFWDGMDRAGHSVPAGTFYYLLQIGPKTYKGQVTLVR